MILRALAISCLAVGLPVAAFAQSTKLTALEKDYQAQGWEAVGRIDMNTESFCSATLIAPNLILTAAHCVYDGNGRLYPTDQITFHAGLRNGQAAARRRVAKLAAHPGYTPRNGFNTANIAHDVALLELAEPIPTHEIDPFVLHGDRVERGRVSVVSYGRGRAHLQSRQAACQLTDRLEANRNVLMFDCNITFGSSGAPVFSHLNGRGRILSVISGMATLNDGRRTSVGPHLPPLIDTLKRDLRAQSTAPTARVRRITVGENRSSGAKFVKVN